MPYITRDSREEIDTALLNFCMALKNILTDENKAGMLNYCFTKILKFVYPGAIKYRQHNEIIGLLDCAKMEYYRRCTSVYEDEKIILNGDV